MTTRSSSQRTRPSSTMYATKSLATTCGTWSPALELDLDGRGERGHHRRERQIGEQGRELRALEIARAEAAVFVAALDEAIEHFHDERRSRCRDPVATRG